MEAARPHARERDAVETERDADLEELKQRAHLGRQVYVEDALDLGRYLVEADQDFQLRTRTDAQMQRCQRGSHEKKSIVHSSAAVVHGVRYACVRALSGASDAACVPYSAPCTLAQPCAKRAGVAAARADAVRAAAGAGGNSRE